MNYDFNELLNIVIKLRDPENGCPWDKKQTSESLIPNFIEELYEMIEAIENKDFTHLSEEIGDILLHIALQIAIASERNAFSSEEVFRKICEKLIRRHPHIFENTKADTVQEVKYNWEKIKLQEKKHRKSVLEGIPSAMPALILAQRTQEKAASVGFDWDSHVPVFDKISEETQEIKEAISSKNQDHIEEEIGDLLFSVVNLSRKLGFDAETALRKANLKFSHRFKKVEQHYKNQDVNMENLSLEELDDTWNKIKKK